MEDRITELEIRLALQDDLLDELNRIVALHSNSWSCWRANCAMCRRRSAIRMACASGGPQHEIPPHY